MVDFRLVAANFETASAPDLEISLHETSSSSSLAAEVCSATHIFTKSMLAVWRDWNLDKILKIAYDKGIVMSGVSAGAICWFDKGLTDSWADELKIMPCMNFVGGNCAPHYDEEPERRPTTKKLLEENIIDSMYGIEGGAALHFIDEVPKYTVRFAKNKNAYNVTLRESMVEEDAFEVKELTK